MIMVLCENSFFYNCDFLLISVSEKIYILSNHFEQIKFRLTKENIKKICYLESFVH